MEHLQPYIPLGMILVAAIGFAVVSLILGRLIGPRRSNPSKSLAYESGMPPFHEANLRIPVKFYMVAILFLLFDLETVFIIAWAVIFNGNGIPFGDPSIGFTREAFRFFALGEMAVFMAILFVGYLYVWKKGGLEWT